MKRKRRLKKSVKNTLNGIVISFLAGIGLFNMPYNAFTASSLTKAKNEGIYTSDTKIAYINAINDLEKALDEFNKNTSNKKLPDNKILYVLEEAELTDEKGQVIEEMDYSEKIIVVEEKENEVVGYTTDGKYGAIDKDELTTMEEYAFESTNEQYISNADIPLLKDPFVNSDEKLKIDKNEKIKLLGINNFQFWKVAYAEEIGYVDKNSISEYKTPEYTEWSGNKLNKKIGTIIGPSGKETYYNLPMGGVIKIMRNIGNTDEYWVREDGVKMLGEYVMVAADLSIRPRGSLIQTSLGMGIVCDTGSFAADNQYQLDIAVEW